jgi:hypothetical protein
MVSAHDARAVAPNLRFRRPQGRFALQEELMDISRRTAGLGLLAYGICTPVAFMSIDSPGGDYENSTVIAYMASGHWARSIALAYLGAFAALGLLPFARRMRSELRSGGDTFWGLMVGATTTAVVGWFLVGGVAVVFAEGGTALRGLPHPVVYALSEMSNLIAVCASAFLVGSAALVLVARGTLPTALRALTAVAGVCGLLAAFFFTMFLFWLWAITFGIWTLLSATRETAAAPAEHQPA